MNNANPVFRSLELIEKRISEKLTVENIANGIYLSKYHYQRIFREIVGDSVMEYVTKRKLTLAGRALLETDAAIIDIALEYGYESREGFTRSFKAYMGVSPTEYRKYGLTAISQKTVKERLNMLYSKTTDEIIRGLNGLIAQAKEAAKCARKCEVESMAPFWSLIADKTDTLADELHRTLTRISAIAENPDEITSRFAIVKAIDDAAFTLNVMIFHAEITSARAKPEDYQATRPILEKYLELRAELSDKVCKTVKFFNELSALIVEDMRKTFAGKMEDVVQKARAAADMIEGYDYIKREVTHMANELAAIPVGEVTVKNLNDNLFKLPILQFSIDADIFRSGGRDKAMFYGIEPLRQSLEEAVDFISSLPKPEMQDPVVKVAKALDDIGYQGNILLFFTRGEAEKLGEILGTEQKAAVDKICEKIEHYIHFTQNSADETAFKPIADRIYKIKKDLSALADELGEYGGALRVIGDTFGQLYAKVENCMKAFGQ